MPRIAPQLIPVMLLLANAVPALAEATGEVEDLRRRLEKLEARQNEPEGFNISNGKKILTISGALEIEGSYTKNPDLPAESDINVATALINFDAAASERVKGRLALLHEDGEEPAVDIDAAFIEVNSPELAGGILKVSAGKSYLPFGTFASNMVSDPLTLELGETNRNAIVAAWQNGKVTVQLGAYNGDRDTTGHNVIDNWVAALTFTPSEQISCGVSYLSALAESNAALLADTDPALSGKNVNAASANLTLKLAPVTITVEYLGALTGFSDELLADPGKTSALSGRQPRTGFAEMTLALGEDWAVSGRYEKAKDFQADLSRYGATASYGLDLNTTLSLEYLYSDFARESANSASQLTVQLALEF